MRTDAAQQMRLAVLASGGGTNFQAILDAVDQGDLPADLVLCLSNKETAGALERAHCHDVATAVINPNALPDEEAFARELLTTLEAHGANFVALAGYLRKIPPRVVVAFRGRMLNIHPALLPAFGGPGMYGRRVHQAVLDYGAHWTGATVHLVDEEYDNGPIVLQEPVPVLPDDTPASLAERVLAVEHRLYPAALRLFAQDRVRVVGRRVRILEAGAATP